MFAKALVSAGKRFLAIMAVVVAIFAALALMFHGGYLSVWEAFKDYMFIGGLVILFIGFVIGGGFAQAAYYRSSLYSLSGNYQKSIHADHMQRRREQQAFMVYCAVAGLLLILLPYLLP